MECPCHSQKNYDKCCEPFHKKKTTPSSPLELMRSRYSAYALNLSQYLIETTHPCSPHYQNDLLVWKNEIEKFSTTHQFIGLEIESEESGFPQAFVTFIAKIKQKDKDCSFKERSCFIFENGKWFFT